MTDLPAGLYFLGSFRTNPSLQRSQTSSDHLPTHHSHNSTKQGTPSRNLGNADLPQIVVGRIVKGW